MLHHQMDAKRDPDEPRAGADSWNHIHKLYTIGHEEKCQPLPAHCTSSSYICIYTAALKVIFLKNEGNSSQKSFVRDIAPVYVLFTHTCAACRFPWNMLLPVCCSRKEYIKQLQASSRCQTAIEMLHARRTVANPGIDALFEIGWTIKQPWKQSSCWDQTRAQLNLRGWP